MSRALGGGRTLTSSTWGTQLRAWCLSRALGGGAHAIKLGVKNLIETVVREPYARWRGHTQSSLTRRTKP